MLNLSIASTIQKYKLAGDKHWIILLDVVIEGVGNIMRLAHGPDDVAYKGNNYIAFNFDFDSITDSVTGELQKLNLKVSNVNRLVEGYLEQYDGGVGATVTLYIIQSANMDGEPDLQTDFGITGATADTDWAVFTLGASNPLRKTFPRYIYVADHCRHVYATPALQAANDPRTLGCKYSGPLASCSKTLNGDNGCRAHSNVINFGGFPGIETQGFRSASLQ